MLARARFTTISYIGRPHPGRGPRRSPSRRPRRRRRGRPLMPGRCAAGRWRAAASGGRRPRGHRRAAGRRRPTSDPPMTITLGLSRLTALARTSPMLRPASRTSWVASTDPPRTSAATSRLVRASTPCGPQPARPRRRRWRRPRGSRRCRTGTPRRRRGERGCARGRRLPPCAPLRSWPSLMIPLPIPVATLTNMRWSTSGNPMACSPRAITLTSLSTTMAIVAEPVEDEAGHVEAVPAGHDRRVRRPSGGVLDRTGQADADAGQVARRASGRGDEAAGRAR